MFKQVNASMTECMISKYIKSNCWNCNDENHACTNTTGNIICSKKNEPGVAENAAKGRAAAYAEAMKKRRKSNAQLANLKL
eukprot:scaffold156785_cov76-Attheya_sp.AAC.2